MIRINLRHKEKKDPPISLWIQFDYANLRLNVKCTAYQIQNKCSNNREIVDYMLNRGSGKNVVDFDGRNLHIHATNVYINTRNNIVFKRVYRLDLNKNLEDYFGKKLMSHISKEGSSLAELLT